MFNCNETLATVASEFELLAIGNISDRIFKMHALYRVKSRCFVKTKIAT